MAVIAVERPALGRDPDDHQPVWRLSEGQLLVDGIQAWRRMATGSRCETWLGWSSSGWYPVVVKLPRPHQVKQARAWATLAREVFVLRRAPHPAVPRLLADRTDADLPHVVMEYVEGPNLADALDDHGALDPRSVVRLGGVLLSALLIVHATGATHCDVKPENVLLRNGSPVLIDFGSARATGSLQPRGRPIGTLGYAAPEMEACAPIHPGMDVFGVGMIMREALRGGRELHAVPSRRRTARGRLRVELNRIADQLCARDAAERPGVAEALRLLDQAAGGELAPPWASRTLHETPGSRA